MTVGIDEIFASLEPKSTATYADVVIPDSLIQQPILPEAPRHVVKAFVQPGLIDLVPGMLLSVGHTARAESRECRAQTLDHFKVDTFGRMAEKWARDLIGHCDFRSVPLPEFASVINRVRSTQSDWSALLELIGCTAEHSDESDDDDALLDLAYSESAYTPRRWSVDTSNSVEVDSYATRAARVYTDADAESWVR